MYGRRHYHRQKQGFSTHYIPLFNRCIFEYIKTSLGTAMDSAECELAWHKLLSFISSQLIDGVELERNRIERMVRKATLP